MTTHSNKMKHLFYVCDIATQRLLSHSCAVASSYIPDMITLPIFFVVVWRWGVSRVSYFILRSGLCYPFRGVIRLISSITFHHNHQIPQKNKSPLYIFMLTKVSVIFYEQDVMRCWYALQTWRMDNPIIW